MAWLLQNQGLISTLGTRFGKAIFKNFRMFCCWTVVSVCCRIFSLDKTPAEKVPLEVPQEAKKG